MGGEGGIWNSFIKRIMHLQHLGSSGSSVFKLVNFVWVLSSGSLLQDYSGSAQYCLRSGRVLHWCSFAGMEDATIQAIFDEAAALNADGEKEISVPGAAGLLVLLDSSSLCSTLNDIEGVYDQRGWPANHSLSLEDFQNCLKDLGLGAINPDDDDDKAEEARQLVSIIDAIGDRMEEKTFPPVKPEEMHGADACTAAQETLQFILKTEAIELQSYHDIKYTEFRRSAPADPNISEKVRRSRFAYQHFYALTIEFYLEKTMRNR